MAIEIGITRKIPDSEVISNRIGSCDNSKIG
jgi:hypothetical protein